MKVDEKDLEKRLCEILEDGRKRRDELASLALFSATSADVRHVGDLVGDREYLVFEDQSDWNLQPKLMQDVIGGMVPDVVLRSARTNENRIYIEVKNSAELNYGKEDSQIVRYFLHLLAMSKRSEGADIRRAVILAAPARWFADKANKDKWNYFLDTYQGLAGAFGITLAGLSLDRFLAD